MPILKHPVDGKIGARYGDTGPNWKTIHTGIDYRVSTGTPVRAAASGLAIKHTGGPYGNRVDITHGDGKMTRYAHLSRVVTNLRFVSQGEIIGYSGATGNVTGAHLHFEVWILGAHTNPEKYLGKEFEIPENPQTPIPPNGEGKQGLDAVSDPNTWFRIGMFVGGLGLAGVGGYLAFKEM